MLTLVRSSHTFRVVQASLCAGSQVSHPTLEQTPADPEPIIHMYRRAQQAGHRSHTTGASAPADARAAARARPQH